MAKEPETDISDNDNITQPGDLTQLLQGYRTKASLGIESVAEALCLPVSSVEALENEEFHKLPEPPYVRGYLRSYSRLASEDASAAISMYDTLRDTSTDKPGAYTGSQLRASGSGGISTHPPAELISPFRFKMGLLTLSIITLIILSMIPAVQNKATEIWDSFANQNEQPASPVAGSISEEVAGNLPLALPPETETPSDASESANSSNELTAEEIATLTGDAEIPGTTDLSLPELTLPLTTDQPQSEAGETTEEEQVTDETAAEETTETAEESPDAAPEGDTQIKLVFADEVWMRIDDANGERLFEALNPAGSEKELSLSKPLKFKIGNAQGLSLFIDGEPMDISEHIKGSVARFGIE